MNEATKFKVVGEVTDRIFDKDGNFIREIKSHNIVVNDFLKVITILIKKDYSSGYPKVVWRLGSNGTTAQATNTDVLTPITNGEVDVTSEVVYIDPSSDEVSSNPTSAIQIKHTFGVNDCNGTWREFSIGIRKNSSTYVAIDRYVHTPIEKTDSFSIERTIKFKFALVQPSS